MTDPIRLVLADDQELVRLGFRMVLDAQADMTVVAEVGNGADAVRAASAPAGCDVVVMDRNIFYYYAKEAGQSMQPFDIAAVFPASLYSAAFKNQRLRNKFNKALAEVQQEPIFTQLQLKYFSDVNQQLQAPQW